MGIPIRATIPWRRAIALYGGFGMVPSGNIGDTHSMFQTSPGSASTLAGRSIANPIATILSASMMLSWLGTKQGDTAALTAAGLIDRAVKAMTGSRTLTDHPGGTQPGRPEGAMPSLTL
ncbi:isocitrate/isopropylmalate family dehydrogenase [Methylobacterium longum]|uniref:Isocitrate/isopropylmalate family dehydrogenase n=1 Tax=Methylobacterium longum TaxID=767694 RepID=A0ABT8AND7_9HYPH|nr:isocitrate/isopropylmalate family dehydrogenase [Methylobacterium longum]MDN3571290.1 isocitrate/isopropylmalate family dehydrogenase [Methylobacterium longum]